MCLSHLQVVVGAADVRMALHVKTGVKVHLDPEPSLQLDAVPAVRALRIRTRKVNAAQNARAFPEHGAAAVHWTHTHTHRFTELPPPQNVFFI